MSAACKIRVLGSALLAVWLAGCPTRPRAPAAPAEQPISGQPAPHEGRPYDIVSGESLLVILVFRAGPLAKAGHNHVIAARGLTGTIYVPSDVVRSTFELHVPVAELSIDEPGLRANEDGADFPADVPESAKEGTRHNMLSEALLDGADYPEILLESERLEPSGTGLGSQVLAHIQTKVRAQPRSITVPVHYELQADALVASGEFPLKQSELGLTPFSALLGALQVQDSMKVKFRLVARPANTRSAPPPG